MPFTLPPPKTKKQSGQQSVYKTYINAHPSMRQYAQSIYKNALDYGVDPVYYASLLWKESFAAAKAAGKDPATILSPTGAGLGIAQINPKVHVGEAVPWAPGRRITEADLKNPEFSIRYGAYYFSRGLAKTGSYEAAYKQYYNPGYTGSVFQDVPKTYVPTTTAKSPTDTATTSVETANVRAGLTATWAVLTPKGVKFVQSAAPPQGTLKVFGQPVDKSSFLQIYSSFSDNWLAYTNQRPTFKQAATAIANGWSQYQVQQALANPGAHPKIAAKLNVGPNSFIGSPVWRQNAPGYEEVYKGIYGPNAKVDQKALRYAISNNLGSAGFAQYLRDQPTYEQSNEFKQSFASSANVFSSIYGAPRPGDDQTIRMAVKHGYDSNQFAQYLRGQPQYKSSAEWQRLMYGLADKMGLIPGGQTVLSAPSAGPAPIPAAA